MRGRSHRTGSPGLRTIKCASALYGAPSGPQAATFRRIIVAKNSKSTARKPAKRSISKHAAAKVLDPVTLEVIRNALPAIANEMAADLQRTSYNMMIYEVRDYCTALLDTKGQLISQNVGGVSHFVADLGVIIVDGMKRYGREGFKPGDVIITNHQGVAGHDPQKIVLLHPLFSQ